MKRAVLYLRVSTVEQTTANQERELREIAGRMGCDITKVYRDHGISGAKGRDKRPQFDALCKAAARREFNTARSCRVTLPKAYQCSRVRRPRHGAPPSFDGELTEDSHTYPRTGTISYAW